VLFSCIFPSKPDRFQPNLGWELFHVLVSSWVDPSTTTWGKGLLKCHMNASQVLNVRTYETTYAPNHALQDPNFSNQCKSWKVMALNVLVKTFTQLMESAKAVLLQTHLIRYASKAQGIWSVLHVMATFKDPLTLDKGHFSHLGSSFVIEIQAHAGRIGLERICWNKTKIRLVYSCSTLCMCHIKAMTTLVEYENRCLYANTNFYSVLIVRSASRLKSSHFWKCCEENFYLCVRLMQKHVEVSLTSAKLLLCYLRLRVQKAQSPHYWHMGCKNLKSVNQYKYLWAVLYTEISDDIDIQKQLR